MRCKKGFAFIAPHYYPCQDFVEVVRNLLLLWQSIFQVMLEMV